MSAMRPLQRTERGRGSPRRLGLAGLALGLLALSGCSALGLGGGGSGYGSTRTGLFRGLGCKSCGGGCKFPKLFAHRRAMGGAAVEGCGEPGISGGPGITGGTVIDGPGMMGTPEALPGTTAPPVEEANPRLEPAGGVKKSNYEFTPQRSLTMKPKTTAALPARTPEPAPAPAGGRPSDLSDALASLPPLRAPAVEAPAPASAAKAEPVAPPTLVATPTADAAAGVSAAPGIARFKVMEGFLAAGGLPGPKGWAFLREKGYRTVVDLRERSEVKDAELADAEQAGLIYTSLPITAEKLDIHRFEQFQSLLANAASRPIYIFDADGSRPAAMWYLRRVAADKRDPKLSAEEAAEIGPADPKLRKAADAYLDTLRPQTTPAQAAIVPVVDPTKVPLVFADKPVFPPMPPDALPAAAPTADPAAWKPFAAMAITGLCVPLAFAGRGMLGSVSGRVRASLPAPRRSHGSLPDESGAKS